MTAGICSAGTLSRMPRVNQSNQAGYDYPARILVLSSMTIWGHTAYADTLCSSMRPDSNRLTGAGSSPFGLLPPAPRVHHHAAHADRNIAC